MSRILGFLAGATLLLLAPLPAAAGDLTLRDVMELRRTGMSDDLLIAIIDADGGPFRLSFADIQDLKSDGLSERVIVALVRTGANQPVDATSMAVAPVQIYQDVITYVPAAVVVVDSPTVPAWRHDNHRRNKLQPGDRHFHRPDHGANRALPPPATWVTRHEDGKNVPVSGHVRSSVPAATWVTPRDPQPRQAPPDEPRPTPH